LALAVTEEAQAWLAERGYDPDFGARPLRRVLERELLNPLAARILAGDFEHTAAVRVEREGEGLAFRAVSGSPAPGSGSSPARPER
jgi:ATP-dependent Clp protease ATP-binding subunit ClpB